MSRVGNNPITVPEGVSVKVNDDIIEVSGKNGTDTHLIHENIKINFKDNVISLERIDNSSVSRSMHGTTRQIISNMIIGITDGFRKDLEIIGVGYQASVQGKD